MAEYLLWSAEHLDVLRPFILVGLVIFVLGPRPLLVGGNPMTKRTILGPCRCSACGELLMLTRFRYHSPNVVSWRDATGRAHRCKVAPCASADQH
jgi:hypothetical protein